MYSCIDDVDNFSRHYFERNIREPTVKIPRDCTECAMNELLKMKLEKPLIKSFKGLKDHSIETCAEILKDLKQATRSSQGEYRGCLKIYDKHSREYFLKFAIMHHEKPSDEIYEFERKKHLKESTKICDQFVECMINEYIL